MRLILLKLSLFLTPFRLYADTHPIQNPWEVERVVWQELARKYHVENRLDELVAYDRKVYPYPLVEAFQIDLQVVLQNPPLAKEIFKVYKEKLLPSIKDIGSKELFALKDWLAIHALLFGNAKTDYLALMRKDVGIAAILKKSPALEKALPPFFQSIVATQGRPYPLGSAPKKRILLITSTGLGGGHWAAAQALEAVIKEKFGTAYETRIVDTRELTKDVDPLMVTTGSMHTEDIYDQIYQQENDPVKAEGYFMVADNIQKFLPNRLVEKLDLAVSEYKPHFIVSTIHHYKSLLSLAYRFDIPLAVVATDYELQRGLGYLVSYLDPSLVRVLIPTSDPLFFEFLQRTSTFPESAFGANESKVLDEFVGKKTLSWEEFNKHFPLFFLLGYPIRDAINPEVPAERVEQLRQKLDLPKDIALITVTMGRQGIGSIASIVDAFLNNVQLWDKPLHIAVLTGKNETLRSDLTRRLSTREQTLLKFHVLGSLSAEEMVALYALSNLWVSKPGGATAAELRLMGVPILAMPHPLWEDANFRFLKSFGLAEAEDHFEKVPAHVHAILQEKKLVKKQLPAPVDWKQRLGVVLDLLSDLAAERH